MPGEGLFRPYTFDRIGYAVLVEIGKNDLFGYAGTLKASHLATRKFKENSPDTFLLWGLGITAQQKSYRKHMRAYKSCPSRFFCRFIREFLRLGAIFDISEIFYFG